MTRGKRGTYWHRWIFTLSIHHFLFTSLSRSEPGNTIRYQTEEEGAPGTVIGHLAKDMSLSQPRAPGTTFRMMRQFNESFVRVRESDGELSVAERIDRERICGRAPRCVLAFDVVHLSTGRYRLIHVEVEVTDANDNSPVFPSRESVVEMSENAPLGSRIPLDPAVDADVGSNYIQSYQVSVNSHFAVDVLLRADGVKYAELVLMRELDRESQSSYAVGLVATDGGSPRRSGSTRITVKVTDFNDNSPVFDQSSFSVTLPEDAPVGTAILDLNAVDADEGPNGVVAYGFGKQAPREVRELFRVDDKSGRLTLRSPLDFEVKRTYEVDVQATDLGSNPTPSVCKIVIHVTDVNDNAPEISITPMTSSATGVAYISEAAEKESLVALVSTLDRDSGANGRVHCALHGHDHFRIRQAHGDSYVIVTAAALDRETIGEYNLTLVAEDLGSPPLRRVTRYTVRLTDENDNAPRFERAVSEVSVAENNPPGAYLTTVEASDADQGRNGKITYRLVDGLVAHEGSPLNTFVSLNSASGALYALRSFNYEVVKQLDVRVQASDGGSPQRQSTAVVRLRIVDQNDNRPSIVEPPAEVLLPRDAPAGYVVTHVRATDADEGANARLSYAIAEGAHLGFSVDKDTGKVRVSRQLMYDVTDSVRVTVSVSDSGSPALTSTAVIHLSFVEGAPPSAPSSARGGGGGGGGEGAFQWDTSMAVIVVLAGGCSLLLLAIVLIVTVCSRRGGKKREPPTSRGDDDKEDAPCSVQEKAEVSGDALIANLHAGKLGFDAHPFPETPALACSSTAAEAGGCEDGRQTSGIFEPNSRAMEGKLKGYSTLPGYGKESVRPITIWKGNSFTTISARQPHISGKDSGKGDSDFNDSDSDISGDAHKKESPPTNSLWACTSECKVLGHSDRCWSPSATRPNTSMQACAPNLTTFSRTASLPRDTRRENHYPAHVPKANALQSVYEKVQHQEFDYILVGPATPSRIQETDELSIPEYTNS